MVSRIPGEVFGNGGEYDGVAHDTRRFVIERALGIQFLGFAIHHFYYDLLWSFHKLGLRHLCLGVQFGGEQQTLGYRVEGPFQHPDA